MIIIEESQINISNHWDIDGEFEMVTRDEVLAYITNHIEYDIGFTEVGLSDNSNTEQEIEKMHSLIKYYNDTIIYVRKNLK